MVPIMGRLNELQTVEASPVTSSKISSESYLSKKTKIFYNNIIDSYVSTSVASGT